MVRLDILSLLVASSVVTTAIARPDDPVVIPAITFPSVTFSAVTLGVSSAVTTPSSAVISGSSSTITGAAVAQPANSLQAAALATANSPQPTGVAQKKKGPFAPPTAEIGGIPSKTLDIPVTTVFLILFIIGAVTHFKIHSANAKMGHKFHLSTLMFDFCMVRNVTCILRIIWATVPNNVSVQLAALVFEFAGTVVVFLVNLFFAQRIMRACHSTFGYHPAVNAFLLLLMATIPLIIVYNISILVLSFFTTNKDTIDILHDFLLFGSSYTLFLAFFPIPFIILGVWIPGSRPVEKFGTGRFRNKVVILLYSAATLSVGGVFRLLSVSIEKPIDQPPWFDSKAAFYLSGFTLEIIVVYLYIFARVDKRFHVPDGASKAGDYALGYPEHGWDPFRRNSFDSEKGLARNASGIDGFGAVSRANTLDEVRAAIENIKLSGNLSSYPVEMGNDAFFYVFRKNVIPEPESPFSFAASRTPPSPSIRYPAPPLPRATPSPRSSRRSQPTWVPPPPGIPPSPRSSRRSQPTWVLPPPGIPPSPRAPQFYRAPQAPSRRYV